MDDLISRQTAIDMFQNLAYDDWNQGASTTWANAFSECAEMIRNFPSAEPEIIRCKNCIWFDRYTDGIEKYQWDGFCAEWARNTYENWYCGRAERR